MMKRILLHLLLVLWFMLVYAFAVVDAAKLWKQQFLPAPAHSRGEHTGVKIYDLNGDGYDDLLFAAGRHSVDQPYALMNLGKSVNNSAPIRFSEAISLGKPGGFYQVDASTLSSLDDGHVAVLLAGGTCTVEKLCQPGSNQSAIVLDVSIVGCSVHRPDRRCKSTVQEIWRDADPGGDRNGAFAPTLGNGIDPAIVLAGRDCISIFESNANGTFPNSTPTFVVIPQEKVASSSNSNKTNNTNIDRAAGLAVGYIGDRPGLIAGLRTSRPPSPLVAVYKTTEGTYSWFDFGGGSQDMYNGDAQVSMDATGVAMADLNGDGNIDVVETNNVGDPNLLVAGVPVDHYFYLFESSDPTVLKANGIPAQKLFSSSGSGRSVTVGQLFEESTLPDLAYGMEFGNILLFANLGLDASTGAFLGFKFQSELQVKTGCTIRDLKIASLAPCTVSVVCAVTCGTAHSAGVSNEIFTKKLNRTLCTEEDAVQEPFNSNSPEEAPLTGGDVQPTASPTQADTALEATTSSPEEDVQPTASPTQADVNDTTQEADAALDAALDIFLNWTLPEEDALTVSTGVEPRASTDTSNLTINATKNEDAALDASSSTLLQNEEDVLAVVDAQPTDGSSVDMSNKTANATAADMLPNEFSMPSSTLPTSSTTRNTNSTAICALFRNLRGCGS